jgi:hypothetical protein
VWKTKQSVFWAKVGASTLAFFRVILKRKSCRRRNKNQRFLDGILEKKWPAFLSQLEAIKLGLMFNGRFFFFDQFVNESRHRSTTETTRRIVFCIPFWVTHEAFVERLFRSYKVVVVEGQLAALAAL